MQLVSEISNQCEPNPPMSRTDGQMDNMQWQDRALHYSASCGKKGTRYRFLLSVHRIIWENWTNGIHTDPSLNRIAIVWSRVKQICQNAHLCTK